MSRTVASRLTRAICVLVGLGVVALAMAWSSFHPDRPSILVEARSFALGTTPRGDYQHHSWLIRNQGLYPLRLRTRFTSGRCGFSLWLGENYDVPVGGELRVALTCPTPQTGNQPYLAYADVLTDDPLTPRVRFRVYGTTSAVDRP